MSSQQIPPQRRSERIQNRNCGSPNSVRPPPMTTAPPPQHDQQSVHQNSHDTVNIDSFRPEYTGTPSSTRTQGSTSNVHPQTPFTGTTMASANNLSGPTLNQQNAAFNNVRANYSQSAPPFSPSRFQKIDSEVTNLKTTVNQMQQSISALDNKMQQLPDLQEQIFARYTKTGPTPLDQTSVRSVGTSSKQSNDGISYATESSLEDEITNLPPGYSQELLQAQNNQQTHPTQRQVPAPPAPRTHRVPKAAVQVQPPHETPRPHIPTSSPINQRLNQQFPPPRMQANACHQAQATRKPPTGSRQHLSDQVSSHQTDYNNQPSVIKCRAQ